MPPLKQPGWVIVGPTASGKTEVAHALARPIHARILSADAMMIYRGMDIGTAKPTPSEIAEFGYDGIDLTTPDQTFSAHDYLRAVEPREARPEKGPGTRVSTAGVLSTDEAPRIVVGGTGLYIRGLLYGLDAEAGADQALRAEARAVLEQEGFEPLKAWCRQRLPEIEAVLPPGDLGNPRRWIRAVERGNGNPAAPGLPPLDLNPTIIGLRRTREDLERRIRARVDRMFGGGLLDEVAQLRNDYATLSETAAQAIGYAEARAVLEGKMHLPEAKEKTVIRTRQYAKRQMTWFRHQLPTRWVEVSSGDELPEIVSRVESLGRSHG